MCVKEKERDDILVVINNYNLFQTTGMYLNNSIGSGRYMSNCIIFHMVR